MPGLRGTSALMPVNKVNAAWRNSMSAALQPHLAQEMQNVPAGSHVRAHFKQAWVDGLSLASKEMSKSYLCSKGVGEEEHYFCIRKGTVVLALLLQKGGELRDCFGCTGHRPGRWLLASVGIILKASTRTASFGSCCSNRSCNRGGLCPGRGRDGLGGKEAGDILPTSG